MKIQLSGTGLSRSADGAAKVSNGLRKCHSGRRLSKFGLMKTGLDEYARRCLARRRIFWFMRFASQIAVMARLRSRESFIDLSLPSRIAGKYGVGIVEAMRILIWSKPCTRRFATEDLVFLSSSFKGTIMSPLANLRTSRIC